MLSSFVLSPAFAFEGCITATLTRGTETQTYCYIVGTNRLCIERVETNWPYAKNIVDLDSGAVTLLFPHNRSFVRIKNVPADSSPTSGGGMPPPGSPPRLPPSFGTTDAASPGGMPPPPSIGPTNLPGMPAMSPMPSRSGGPPGAGPPQGTAGGMSPMPMVPPMPMQRFELQATDQTTNLLGYSCKQFELKQGGEIMEIWATDRLLPFWPYLQNQPHRFGPRQIEEQWGEMLKAKKLFPLLAVLRFERPAAPGSDGSPAPGPERLRFEVKSVRPDKITDETLFQPPPDYREIQPLPF